MVAKLLAGRKKDANFTACSGFCGVVFIPGAEINPCSRV